MCQEVSRDCSCGKEKVSFHLRDNIMSQEVIDRLFCPSCSGTVALEKERMVEDNGWIIEYDMELARMYAIAKLGMEPAQVQPCFVFDEGYVTWREMYPGETRDIGDERQRIISMKEKSPREYLTVITAWTVERISRLKAEGWRKAQDA
ncbi:MAG: hypothetical protein K0A99_03725 [Desulfoarculaceae bacterium]|nr:hypothetical protein [Desulfoarculaceae bacterium]